MLFKWPGFMPYLWHTEAICSIVALQRVNQCLFMKLTERESSQKRGNMGKNKSRDGKTSDSLARNSQTFVIGGTLP